MGGNGQQEGPPSAEQVLGMLTPIDKNNTLMVGKLLAGVQQTERELLFKDPEIIDETSQEPKQLHAPYEDVVPWKGVDAMGNLLTIYGIARHGGEYQTFSFADLVTNVRQRFDPLPTDPRDVGPHYTPQPWAKSGLSQLMQSTTGKVLVFTAAMLIGYLLGVVTVGLHVGHF